MNVINGDNDCIKLNRNLSANYSDMK